MKKLVLLMLVAGVGVLSAADDAARRRLAKLVSAVGAKEIFTQDSVVASRQQSAVTQVLEDSKEEMRTLFRRAVQDNDVQKVREFLPKIDVNEKDVVGNTAFMYACRSGEAEVVKLLLADSRVDVNEKDLFGNIPFMVACVYGQAEIVKLLLADSRVDINANDQSGYIKFRVACSDGRTEVVKLLLADSRIDVTGKDTDGDTAFMRACVYGHTEVVKLLLADSRIDVTGKDEYGYTPFMRACNNGHTEVVKLLLADSRIDVTEKNAYGNTPFMRACSNDHTEIVKLLLADSRVDVNTKDKNGYTAFMSACLYEHTEVVKLLLTDNRVDVNEKDEFGYTPLNWACNNGHTEVVKLLLADSRVDVNEKDKYGDTAFMRACSNGKIEVVKLLLANDRVDLHGAYDYRDLLVSLIVEAKSKDLYTRFSDIFEYLFTHEVEIFCAAFADDHELCVKIKKKVLPPEKAQEYIRWQMLEREKAASLPEQKKEQLAAPFAQELRWQEEGLMPLAHGCEYQFGIFRDAYARLQRKLAPVEQKYPAYFHAFRFPTQQELQEKAWSKEQAQEQLTLRKHGRSDNSLYIFCQTSLLHGIQNYEGESPGYYWLNNWSIQNISLTLAQVLQGLVDPVIIQRYQHKLAQVQQLYDNTVTSSTKGLLYLFAVTPEFVKNCVGYRHNFTRKDELTSSEQYLQSGKYERVEHLIPQLYVTAPEYVNAHIKDMKVYGYDVSTPEWEAYETKLEEVLDLLVYEQKELERIGKVAYVQQMKESALRQQGLLSYFKALKNKIPLISRL